jgi:hypothetical protein
VAGRGAPDAPLALQDEGVLILAGMQVRGGLARPGRIVSWLTHHRRSGSWGTACSRVGAGSSSPQPEHSLPRTGKTGRAVDREPAVLGQPCALIRSRTFSCGERARPSFGSVITASTSPCGPPAQVKSESASVAMNHRWSAGHSRCGARSSSSLDEPVAGSVAPQGSGSRPSPQPWQP